MNQRKALKTLGLLILISLSLFLLNFILRRAKPELYLQESLKDPAELAISKHNLLDDLPLTESDTKNLKRNDHGVLAWPLESVLPAYHKADLNLYQDRSKNEHALEGILVFIDAGETEVPIRKPEPGSPTDATKTGNEAPTDPITGYPVSTYAQRRLEQAEATTTKAQEKMVAPSEILDQLATFLEKELTRMGAEVILTREVTSSRQDLAQQAVVARHLASGFLEELKEQKFRSSTIETLMPTLFTAVDNPDDVGVQALFSSQGVSPGLRVILDLERQYRDACMISLRLGEDETGGLKIQYYGESSAANFGQTSPPEDAASPVTPAYQAYDSYSRTRLAEQLERNIRELLPEFAYQGDKSAVTEAPVLSGRYNNLVAVEIQVGQKASEENIQLLAKESNLKKLAENMALSLFQFYCD